MLTTLVAAMLLPAMDHGVLIGLRAPDETYRTVLVSTRGVAFVAREHKGELLRPMKMVVHAFNVDERGLVYQGNVHEVPPKTRIAWAGVTYVGLETDRSLPGEKPFTRTSRRVGTEASYKSFLNETDETARQRISEAASTARKKVEAPLAALLPEEPDQLDWGYVRSQGKWVYVGAFAANDKRVEFEVHGKPPTNNPPHDRGLVAWRSVLAAHPDATDIVSSQDAPFAVVVTPDFLHVHEASRTTLGREVRRIPSKQETVVCFSWGASGPLEKWLEYIRG